MKTLNPLLTLATVLLALTMSRGNLLAQADGGAPAGGMQAGGMRNFDPQQMQQMMMGYFRTQMVVTNDEEWNVIETRLTKVVQARMESMFSGMGNAFRGMRGGGNRNGGGGQAGGARGFGGLGQPSPEADALQKSLDDEAPSAEIKSRLEKLREARKKKASELAAAQKDLRQVLSLRQEAVLVSMGLLD